MYQLCLVWAAVLTVTIYLYFRRLYSSFERAGVKALPAVPLVGHMLGMVLQKEHQVNQIERMCAGNEKERFVGKYEFINPALLVQDLELVKSVTVKDFEHFVDHRHLIDDTVEPLLGRIVFNLKGRLWMPAASHQSFYKKQLIPCALGQEWKHMRSTLSPAFTSSKMKLMVPFMVDVGDQMLRYLKKTIKDSGGYVELNALELSTRYANDVIASCAFGTKVDSHNEVDNYFYTIGKKTASLGYKEMLKFLGYGSFPNIMKMLRVSILSEATKSFFRSLILSSMKTREEKSIVRNDMIHLLIEAKKGKLVHESNTSNESDVSFAAAEESTIGRKAVSTDWADDDLVAQAVVFFFAGFDTVSTASSWLLHELAVNPDVQERLYREIKENDERNGGKFDYKSIQEMKYLDMVLSETLRKWPPVPSLDRICTKDYNLGKPNDKAQRDYIVRKGQSVTVPAWMFHRNPKYYPEPLKFDPERFSEENKHKINPFVYMPFGLGPRNCIGSRFALYEIKVLAYKLLQQLEIFPCEKTCLPEQLDNSSSVHLRMRGGFWLRFRMRN